MADRPLILFAPGAGAPSSHPWMRAWQERLGALGEVKSFDYDYMREGRRRPDPLPVLVAAHRAALLSLRTCSDAPLFLAGKSMGGRIGCHLALEENVAGIICFGYPLCGGGNPTRLRDEVLRQLATPILFLQGTRDPLCPLERLAQVRLQMSVPNELHAVTDGDHSLRVPKKNHPSQQEIDCEIFHVIENFIASRRRNLATSHPVSS